MGNKEVKKTAASLVKAAVGVTLVTAGTVLGKKAIKELGEKLRS